METQPNAIRPDEVPDALVDLAASKWGDPSPMDVHMIRVELAAVLAEYWIVPKIAHDANSSVRPYILHSGRVRWDACTSGPDHARQFAAQILAAADDAEKAEES